MSVMAELEETYDVRQVAGFLHLTEDQVRKIITGKAGANRRRLKAIKPGKDHLVLRSDLEEYCGLPEGALKARGAVGEVMGEEDGSTHEVHLNN